MTEEEAKTKKCPNAPVRRFWSWKHFEFVTEHGGCAASRCMAWRWLPNHDVSSKIQAIKDYRTANGCDLKTAKDAVEASWKPEPTSGFCGLAGYPS